MGKYVPHGGLLVGRLETLWIILGTVAAVASLGASVFYFVNGRNGRGIVCLLLIPVAFAGAVVGVVLAVMAGIVWLVAAAVSR
jgi:hypothetical protein